MSVIRAPSAWSATTGKPPTHIDIQLIGTPFSRLRRAVWKCSAERGCSATKRARSSSISRSSRPRSIAACAAALTARSYRPFTSALRPSTADRRYPAGMSNTAELTALATQLLEGRNVGHLATVNPNGTVQVTPVWVHVEDGRPVFNTAEGRQKWRNILRDPRVTIEVTDSADAYSYVEIRGT